MAKVKELVVFILNVRRVLAKVPPELVDPLMIASIEGTLQDLQDLSPEKDLGTEFDDLRSTIGSLLVLLELVLGIDDLDVRFVKEDVQRLH